MNPSHFREGPAVKLFTLQTPGIDITSNVVPTADYRDAFYDLGLYLGWTKWIWCLRDFAAFEVNAWIQLNSRQCLWVLDIPGERITWASLEGQCEGKEPAAFIFPHPYDIEALGENAMGLVNAPIKPDWVLFRWTVEP